MEVLAGVFGGEKNHVDGLLLGLASAAGADIGISLDDCLGGQFSYRLERAAVNFAIQNEYIGESGSGQRGLSPQCHCVVTADHALNIGGGLEQAFHHAESFSLAPIGGLLGNHFHLMADEVAQHAIRLFDHVTTALVGIGAIDPSPLLAQSGNIFSPQELDLLRQEKAVGDILMRFFDQNGKLVETGLEKRVISMSLEQLSKVSRAVGVAGGSRKYAGILGALRGRWINILITDHFTARRLADQ